MAKKIITGDALATGKPSTESLLFEKAQEYIAHYHSQSHLAALDLSDTKQAILPFQAAVIAAFGNGETLESITQALLREGFSEQTEGNTRVLGRLKNWSSQWFSGNRDYFQVQ